ncbi:hypothetical protein QT381_08355 [Galbitalea sp. SE-J8]|uniref:hypothetical protein n=1 Tax=Galbitalea sp. SE-J8 TaxID=3054952 RepID=UPI00259CE2D4|nr:hypothetical protein [Galbitalea sp. SE-J8]MDM4763018.1 hypothetical protein [Galbitalea sp. SE-J8]
MGRYVSLLIVITALLVPAAPSESNGIEQPADSSCPALTCAASSSGIDGTIESNSLTISGWIRQEVETAARTHENVTDLEHHGDTAGADEQEIAPALLGNDCVYSRPVDPGSDVCGEHVSDEDTGGVVVTLSDVARFAPGRGVVFLEPEGWALVGLPMNAYGAPAPVTASGVLFGAAVQVRFTALSWRWDFGDGVVLDTVTAGGSWRTLGQDEFTTTDSSHVYAGRGTVQVVADVIYRAEYRFAGVQEWTPVEGTLTVRSGEWDVLVGTASTVLVNGSCTQNPTGPGC